MASSMRDPELILERQKNIRGKLETFKYDWQFRQQYRDNMNFTVWIIVLWLYSMVTLEEAERREYMEIL